MSDLPPHVFDADERIRRAYLAGLQPAERDVQMIRTALRLALKPPPTRPAQAA